MDILDADIRVMKEKGQEKGGPLQGLKNGTDPFFYRARDPTVLLVGTDSGWPTDFNDSVNVRIPLQTVSPSTTIPSTLSDLVSLISSKFPDQAALKNAGTHIKPENKFVKNGQQLSSAVAAVTVADFCPFKPGTHGQFRFTKFNVIDKFGQALVAIDPKPRVGGPEPLYPCIRDYYEPQPVALKDETKVANTAMKNSGLKCEFIRLSPRINQNSPLNASFVVSSGDEDVAKSKPYWLPTTEWENPIWGWVVLNYADQGIQLFSPNGSFYREIRFGGPGGVITKPKWLPFKRDDAVPPVENIAQLDTLIARMGDGPGYARGFWDMLSMAVDNIAPAPSAYAEFLSSIVGRPMALANMGWSLELEGAPLANQSTRTSNNTKEPLMHLISKNDDDINAYKFQLKLDDFFREYDGLVGYFDANKSPDPGKNRGDELLLDGVKTYFCDESKATNLTAS
ncbi:hypothetical protein FMUND_1318 [Fusarium mundagurra]|uniref:Uncharacterized protein n=1 Tax=Fusarium mundagurra TaxID=1567541 RepID=A0A8H5Z4K4_9HYPO|nr:hypothetical protein FMUND_1318 [Fusarium mundagurra]